MQRFCCIFFMLFFSKGYNQEPETTSTTGLCSNDYFSEGTCFGTNFFSNYPVILDFSYSETYEDSWLH